MNNQSPQEPVKTVLNALDDAIKQGPWNQSNFLRLISKSLIKLRDELAVYQTDSTKPNEPVYSQLANRVALRAGQIEVFIALYSSDGFNMFSWERILVNLPSQMISRSIYAKEDDVKEMIRSKANKINEAYVSVFINQSDIMTLQPDKMLFDKLGKPLLSLKDKSMSLKNINRFVHLSGEYQYSNGRLVKKS